MYLTLTTGQLFYPKLIAHGLHGPLGDPVMLPVVVGLKVGLGYRMHQQKMVGQIACQLMLQKLKIATLMVALVRLNTSYRRQLVDILR